MRRKDVYITDEQVIFLSELGGTISEHIRRAIDEYIQKIKNRDITTSMSKNIIVDEKGGKNGGS